VYDQALRRAPLSASRWTEAVSMWGTLAGSAALMVLAIAAIRAPQRAAGAALALILPAWGTAAVLSVKLTWSAYYYQVLSHPCPWCLFLPEYYGAGFLIFGCLAVVLAEGVAIGLAGRVRRRCPLLAPASAHRIRQAGWRIAIALVGFSILTLGPAVAWRLRTGVWLQGTP
jgi:hypothetical protein